MSGSPYRDGVEQLLRNDAPFTVELLAQLVAGHVRPARAFCSNLYRQNVLKRIDDDTYEAGDRAKWWLGRPNKTNAGGNAASYRRRRAAREQLLRAQMNLAGGTPSTIEIREAALLDDSLLTAAQAAQELNLHKTTIIRRICKGNLRGYRDREGRYMVYRCDIHRALTLVTPKGGADD